MNVRKKASEDMRWTNERKKKLHPGRWAVGSILIIFCILFWLPVVIMGTHAWMGEAEVKAAYGSILGEGGTKIDPRILPVYPTLAPMVKLLLDSPEYFVMFWNSVKQVLPILVGQMLIGVPAAWAFGRYQFWGRRFCFLLYMVLMIMPFQVTMVSSYLVLSKLSLMDTHGAVILPGVFSTFPVFLMHKFFRTIPESLIEAARMDGAGPFHIFLRVGIPLGRPGIFSALLLNFLEYWNAMEQPMTFIKTKSKQPLSLYLSQITSDQMGSAFAASLVMMIPAVLIFWWGQEYLEQGIAASGIKE